MIDFDIEAVIFFCEVLSDAVLLAERLGVEYGREFIGHP